MTSRLDHFLAYAESNRPIVSAIAIGMIACIAWVDWLLFDMSIGFLYLIPILFSAAALKSSQILAMAMFCAYLREALDPLQETPRATGWHLLQGFIPTNWVPGSSGRVIVVIAGFAMTGFFVAELNQRRRLLSEHLAEREQHIHLREDAERQLRILIETSPLAILTLDEVGNVLLFNESAREILGFGDESLRGQAVERYLPILSRMLHSQHSGANIRTNVECTRTAPQWRSLPGARLAFHLPVVVRTGTGGGDLGRIGKPARPGRRRSGFHDGYLARADWRHLARDPQPGVGRVLRLRRPSAGTRRRKTSTTRHWGR